MKKWLSLMLSLVLTLSFGTSVFAEKTPDWQVSIYVDGELSELSSEPLMLVDNTTYAPASTLFELIGISEDELDVTIVQVDGVAYAPIRLVSETAGYKVGWNAADRAILLVAPTESAAEASQGFLWKTENEGKTLYLLGSIHVADNSLYPLRSEITEAFAQADVLAVEVDISNATTPEVTERILEMSMLPEDQTLPELISEETYARLGEFLIANGLETNQFDGYYPWVVATTIQTLQGLQAGYDPAIGVDMHLLEQAMANEVEILELESYESQMVMMSSYSLAAQEASLNQSLDAYEGETDEVVDLVNMWIQGDEDMLLQVIREVEADPESNKLMLADRNHAMHEQLLAYLESDSEDEQVWFVVVGAAHMLGETGLVTLLEDAGYVVERQ